MLPDCTKSMVFFNCTTASPGTAGVECPDSCQIQDKDCVSAQSFMDMNTKKKKKRKGIHTLLLTECIVAWSRSPVSSASLAACVLRACWRTAEEAV